jgi:DNA-binding NarL/FixJ family response regulator
MTRIRLIIVDDHPVVRTGISGMLTGHPDLEIVGEAETGQEAVELAGTLKPDVVLMDLRMPGMEGVEATEQIKAQHPEINILVLTTYDTDADIFRAIEAGATGYMLKDSPRDDLHRAILAAARSESVLAPVVATRLLNRMTTPASDQLSLREIEVLELVAQGNTNREIGSHLKISEATVKTHLVHIYEKLQVPDRAAAVTKALAKGIIRH